MRGCIHRLRRVAAGLIAALAAGGAAAAGAEPPRQVGPFEISAHGKRVGDSGRWMRTGNPFGSYAVREYAVRWRGGKVSVPGAGERFWQALHLPDAPRPALLLASGPSLHLVSELDGRLETHALAPGSGSTSLQWLDGDAGQPAAELPGFPLDRVDAAPKAAFAGGRWLYVNHRLVLDVRTLTMVTIEPWSREGQGEAVVEMNASNSPAIAFSPGRTRFVLAGEGQDFRRDGERFELLLLVDLSSGRSEGLRLDPRRTPYARPGDLDAAWFARHFRWERDAAGREQLRPR